MFALDVGDGCSNPLLDLCARRLIGSAVLH
jgi:hypothetical protein